MNNTADDDRFGGQFDSLDAEPAAQGAQKCA